MHFSLLAVNPLCSSTHGGAVGLSYSLAKLDRSSVFSRQDHRRTEILCLMLDALTCHSSPSNPPHHPPFILGPSLCLNSCTHTPTHPAQSLLWVFDTLYHAGTKLLSFIYFLGNPLNHNLTSKAQTHTETYANSHIDTCPQHVYHTEEKCLRCFHLAESSAVDGLGLSQ